MKLLFKYTTADEEVKQLLGFTDADFTFNNLISDIITATRDVVKIIGKDLYNKLLEYDQNYIEEDLEDINYNILRAVKYPIAIRAYSYYVPNNDLSHTTDGRKMRNEEHESNAFQWMIDNDNAALEKKYYRAIDDLIELLDESKPNDYNPDPTPPTLPSGLDSYYHLWITSDNYKKEKKHFLNNINDFDTYFPIQSRLLFIRVQPGIDIVEKNEILPRIGKELFNSLKEKTLKNETLNEFEQNILDKIKASSAYYSLAWAFPRYSVNLFPEGILQYYGSDRQSTSGKKPALMSEPELVRQSFMNDANIQLLAIEKLITENNNLLNQTETEPITIKGDTNDKYFNTF